MDITLYVNSSERQEINKSLSNDTVLTGILRGESSVISPTFTIEHANPSGFNYCYIPDFGRYYFITNITSVRNSIWRIDCSVDVLMSFKDAILALEVVVSDNTDGDNETYVNGKPWVTTVKSKTDVIMFPSGLLDSGEYILITSGGVSS